MLDTLRHLLPDSTAWRLVIERTLKKYLRGVATVGSDVVEFVDDVYDDLWPDLTRELQEWLNQFGIDYWPWSNDDDMRAYLDFRWGEDRSTSPKALQDKIRAAGFADAYVYDSFDRTDVSLSTYANDSFSIAEDATPSGFCFANGGYKMYVAGGTSYAIYQYTLTTPYGLSTASYDSVFKTVTTQDSAPTDVKLSADGTKMLVLGDEFNGVHEYDLASPFEIAGATYVDSMSVATQETNPLSFHWKPDGTEVYVTGTSSDDVHQYTLGTAWDVSTGGFTRTYDPGITDPTTVTFNDRGTSMFLMPAATDVLSQWDLGTAWDISTASTAGHSVDMSTEDATPLAVVLESNHLFMLGTTTSDIFRYRHGAWRNPLDYADQPLTGTVQCGDDGSAQNPVAECGEEPPDQISLDSAVCNRVLANEVWYLVNDTLTNDAPPKISEFAYPLDSFYWGNYWYIGGDQTGSTINELEVDEYDRQRLEKLCLKHGPTNAWIVTVFDIWRTTLLGPWKYQTAGGNPATGAFRAGTTYVYVDDEDNDGSDQDAALGAIVTGDKLRFERMDDGSWAEFDVTDDAIDGTTYWSVECDPDGTPAAQSSDWTDWPADQQLVKIYLRESV
jgi:hypothetical protein